MKKLVAAVLLGVSAIGLTACEGGEDSPPNGVIIVGGVPYFY
ncbi:hypothetical protein SEA_HARRYOW_44 [Mycobacterium phage HarryOW]|uniref:Lipoprotein n=2 Tax=Fromanvirus TaxID=186764 RepID=G1D395_9CAUD|nr:hypothetical protein CM08_gp44 [Mycobacterium phage Bruns]YP_009636771.1 hypothetical protein FGG24_gp46 [Mycobacterium phage JC27]AVJ49512.1 hypothetical protein SEA_CORVO_46 [Mycobacterium phage Corvo]AVJ49696.1 hypothetical protein SEA_FORSYTHEAST_45 [Mycobacterium phage Forsytheast]AXH45214.1 hypothetical protein SEA_SWISSCHEESE_47 [Mycobacterium phage SwissCheese]AXH46178.1 hypothetical protein SEA_MOOSE_45 [Mycobacterium phage Moose]AXH68066.1 hypothetical protein SEA_TARGET_46 [Myco